MKNKAMKATMIFLLFFFGFSAFSQENEGNIAEVLYQEGLKKYILHDFLGAIDDFQSAYNLNNNESKIKNMYINALIKQGDIEYKQKNFETAREHFSLALELSGDDKTLAALLTKVNQAIEDEKKIHERTGPTPTHMQAETPGQSEKTTKPVPTGIQSQTTRTIPPVIKVELPYDMEEFIRNQNQENMRVLSQLIESQKQERKLLLDNINLIAEAQTKDRVLFSNLLYIILGIIGGIMTVILFVLTLILIRRRKQTVQASDEMQSLPSYDTRRYIEETGNIDESKYITDEHYSELIKAKRLSNLYLELRHGTLDWDTLQNYITELNFELKTEVLNLVENIIQKGEMHNAENAIKLLLPFITDNEENIRLRSKDMFSGIAKDLFSPSADETGDMYPDTYAVSLSNLYNLAHMIDNKTDRENHSLHVAEIAGRIAEVVNQYDLDPLLVRKIGLVHDIGFLEIDDAIIRKQGALGHKQFDIIKTHPEKGIRFFSHVEIPKIFEQGILYHHERLDGSGYPEGLRGDNIPLIARIIAVADIFDAATSPRPYKKSFTPEQCLTMMDTITGTLIDKEMVDILAAVYEKEKGKSDEKQ